MHSTKKIQTKELRTGYTTGTCSAAVAKASAMMLINQKPYEHVELTLPDGSLHVLEIKGAKFNPTEASCYTVKDAGDDPDVTHGAEIHATAKFITELGVKISAGKGIGSVTRPGLPVEVGQPAINPIPRKMILEAVGSILPERKGIEITLSIPAGEELAKRTFNPRLGIVGGISVLGTTGIVKPMSEEALKASLVVKLHQLRAHGVDTAVYAPGNYATYFANESLSFNTDDIVLTSNYIGFMLEEGVKAGMKKVVLVGHPGKLVKVAGGIFQTHSRVSDARNEILAAHYMQYSKDMETFEKLMKVNTTEEAIELIPDESFWNYMAQKVKERCELFTYNELQVECILFSQVAGKIGESNEAMELLKAINNE